MSWIANFVRPKLQKLVGGRKEVPDNLWHKCPNCGQMIFHRDLTKNLKVCQHCNHHMRLGANERLEMLFDDGVFEKVEVEAPITDPLKFRDVKRYTDRLKESKAKTKSNDAIMVAHGKVGGAQTVMAAFDFAFMGGSMGLAVGDGVIKAARLAVKQHTPLVVLTSSGGARMQEGIHSLMQLARTTIAVEEVREAGLPYIVILCDPTTGGVSASLAMLGDIHISEPGAVIGFAGQRVIEQTIRETLPEGFQRAEYLLEHGMIDMVVPRKNLQVELAKVIDLLMVTSKATKPMTVTTKSTAIVEAEILPPVTVTNADIKSDADSKKDGIESRDESKK
ncbi:MAG: acetyl-CoA carboxylase, carboxyltransferase subunit beta [Rhodospirillales bacterium]